MKPEEIRNLTIECWKDSIVDIYEFYPDELAAYTAAVEARERERCRLIADEHPHHYGNAISLIIGELK